jgi:hypothetical protein
MQDSPFFVFVNEQRKYFNPACSRQAPSIVQARACFLLPKTMTAWFLAGDVFDQSIAKSMTEPQGQCRVYNV